MCSSEFLARKASKIIGRPAHVVYPASDWYFGTQGDPNGGTIGQHSAIGRALLGARKGDEIEAVLPVGEVSLIIKEIDKAPENVRKAS